MYGHFIQFTIPKIGQALVAVVLYLNLLKLPFVACFAGAYPAVYLLLPLLLLARKLLTRTCSIRKQFQTVAILV